VAAEAAAVVVTAEWAAVAASAAVPVRWARLTAPLEDQAQAR
jgi:hypothetical protein